MSGWRNGRPRAARGARRADGTAAAIRRPDGWRMRGVSAAWATVDPWRPAAGPAISPSLPSPNRPLVPPSPRRGRGGTASGGRALPRHPAHTPRRRAPLPPSRPSSPRPHRLPSSRSQIPSGSFVWIEATGVPDPPSRRLARALKLEGEAERGVAYVCPQLAHNLGLRFHLDELATAEGGERARAGVRVSRCVAATAEETPQGSVALRMPGGRVDLPIAGLVQLAELRSPEVSFLELYARASHKEGEPAPPTDTDDAPDPDDSEAITAAIEKHFGGAHRLISTGDVVSVPVPAAGHAVAEYFSGNCPRPLEMMHFTVASMAPARGPCVFVPGKTGAAVRGRSSGAAPAGVGRYLGLANASTPGVPGVPGTRWLLPRWRTVASLLAAVLNPRNAAFPLRCAEPGSAEQCGCAWAADRRA